MLFTEFWLTVDTVVEFTLQVDRKKESDRKGVEGGITVKEQLCSKDIELTGVSRTFPRQQ